jgi:[ribosomal protein S5]-alanine N-acetyltransferase
MEIETKRLLLRPLREEDAPAMALALNNYDVAKNLARVPFPYSVEDAKFFINLQRKFGPDSLVCAIAFKCAPDELIGIVAYEDNLEFGYWLSEACWRMGLMSEAAAAVVEHAFVVTKLEYLVSCYHNDNPNSGRILRSVGFEEHQQCTSYSVAQGKDVDVTNLRLTRQTWFEKQKSRGE